MHTPHAERTMAQQQTHTLCKITSQHEGDPLCSPDCQITSCMTVCKSHCSFWTVSVGLALRAVLMRWLKLSDDVGTMQSHPCCYAVERESLHRSSGQLVGTYLAPPARPLAAAAATVVPSVEYAMRCSSREASQADDGGHHIQTCSTLSRSHRTLTLDCLTHNWLLKLRA